MLLRRGVGDERGRRRGLGCRRGRGRGRAGANGTCHGPPSDDAAGRRLGHIDQGDDRGLVWVVLEDTRYTKGISSIVGELVPEVAAVATVATLVVVTMVVVMMSHDGK